MHIRTCTFFLLLGALLIASWPTAAQADALDDEYAAMRAVPGAGRDFVRARLDPGITHRVRTGSPCASPCPTPCTPPRDPCCPQRGCWEWRIALYGWLPGVGGDAVLGGQASEVDYEWTDWFDILDKVDFALQAGIQVRYDRWLFAASGMRALLGDSVPFEITVPLPGPIPDIEIRRAIDAEVELRIMKGAVGYELGRTRLSSCRCLPEITWFGYAGVRYYSLGVEANLDGGPDGSRRLVDRTRDWLDPLIGGRGVLTLDERWSLVLDADVGGFGAGSELSWHLLAGAEWRVARWFALQAGWNVLDIDYTEDHGDRRFGFDVTFSGPFIGFVFIF